MNLEDSIHKTVELNPSLEKILSKQLPHGPITKENESQFSLLVNGLQIALALREVPTIPQGTDESNVIFEHWREKHSVKFRKVLEEIIAEDPLYFDEYKTLKEIPDVVLVDIERRLNE